jgi:hypothetical protein
VFDATPFLKYYARWRLRYLRRQDPVEAQRLQWMALIKKAEKTAFGKDHNFARLKTIEDYQKAVPLRRYEDFWKEYWRRDFPRLHNCTWPGSIPYFANSSGTTTGETKQIPVSVVMLRSNKKAVFDLLSHHVVARPKSRVLGGKNFFLGGTTNLKRVGPGAFAGDLSGIAAATVPWWARPYYFPRGETARMSDWEVKTRALAEQSLVQDIRSISGTANWLLLFIERLRANETRPSKTLRFHYPNLELIAHGGISFAPYRRRFQELLEGTHAETREVYPASEGFVAVADIEPEEGLRLIVDHGLFFEFVPVEELANQAPRRHWLGNLEAGVNYALVISSCAGLWSYVLGDTVRFSSLKPPRLVITGRTSSMLSSFGEHLSLEEIEHAVSAASAAVGVCVTDFAVGPLFQPGTASGRHLYVVELDKALTCDDVERFCHLLDQSLLKANLDYREHRLGNFALQPPEVKFVRPGFYAEWMKSRGRLGAQFKVPRVFTDPDRIKALAAWTPNKQAE